MALLKFIQVLGGSSIFFVLVQKTETLNSREKRNKDVRDQ